MRNYILLSGLKWHASVENFPGLDTDLYTFGSDEEDLFARQQAISDQFVEDNPPPGPDPWVFTYENDPIQAYFLLSQTTFLDFIAQPNIAAYVYINSVDVDVFDQAFRMVVNPNKSPRYTGWREASGKFHRPSPSDKRLDVR